MLVLILRFGRTVADPIEKNNERGGTELPLKIPTMRPINLTAKQSRFVSEYLVDGNGAAAAVRAGYAKRSAKAIAAENLTKPDILKELQARQTADATRLSIQREDVLNGLVEAAAMAKLQCDPAGMVAAWKQVGHLMGYYSPERIKVDVNLAGSLEIQRLNQLSDAELLKIIEAGWAVQPERLDFDQVAG